ncbi:MAG TPA: type VI secretion system tube protein Hcp [Longimicrobium sp.]|nr:type VI secretion system tube protein Hcp [Longimicrobium sp.]
MDVILMQVKDVPGTSLMTGYTGQIELMSYSHGVSMQVTGDVSNTERTSGKPRHQDFHVTKYLDKSSPLLNQKCCQATDLGQVLITVGRNDNGTVIPLIIYTLSNAVLSSVSVGGGGGDKPVESVSINYSGIKWDYTAQKEAGGKDGTVSGSWDVGANKTL